MKKEQTLQEKISALEFEVKMLEDTNDVLKVKNKALTKQLAIHSVSKRTFRKAKPEDIVEGNTVYLLGDDKEIHTKIIDEVLRPDDQWKAFCADDGCRYGLEDLYVCYA